MAIQAGFCEEYAKKVADADQAVDDNFSTSPEIQYIIHLPAYLFGKLTGSNDDSMRSAMQPHFPIDPANTTPDSVVKMNSSFVNTMINNTKTDEQFGAKLHTYQDSYSHRSYRNDHIDDGTAPDKTWINERWKEGGRDFEMARNVYEKLKQFLEKHPEMICKCPPTDFNHLANFIEDYLREKDLIKKEHMLRDQGLSDYAKPNPYYNTFTTGQKNDEYDYRMVPQEYYKESGQQ